MICCTDCGLCWFDPLRGAGEGDGDGIRKGDERVVATISGAFAQVLVLVINYRHRPSRFLPHRKGGTTVRSTV